MKRIPVTSTILSGIATVTLLGMISCVSPKEKSPDFIVAGESGDSLEAKLTPYLEKMMDAYDLPGLSIGVVQEGEIVYAKAFGSQNIKTLEPVTIRSLFHMASISKPFVATAVMQLVEQGKLGLEDPVIRHIPYFHLEGGPYDSITIRQMLNHISGLPDVQDYEWENPVYDEGALEQYVRSISGEKMIAPPEKKFAYSNMAFECLGDVISKASGKTFADYVKENILDPTGMGESTFLKPEYLPGNWAAPHLQFSSTTPWDGYPYNRMHGPSSTLHSNAVEMCRWAIINMNRGIQEDQQILESGSYDLLWKPWFQTGEKSHVGLSWFLGEYRGEKTVGHGGGDTGFNTEFVMLPDRSMAVAVLCNLNPAPVGKIGEAAMDVLLGHEPGTVIRPASIPVYREMKENGVDAAAALWDSLQVHHAGSYDFGPRQFVGLFIAMDMDRAEEAVTITRLCVKILSAETIQSIRGQAEWYSGNHPENEAAKAILRIIKEAGSEAM